MALIKIYADTNIGLRDNNEDDYTVCSDLTRDEWEAPDNTQVAFPLGRHGCLMVVADGMGGMNAGEVASDIAIRTVQEMFAPSVLTSNVNFKQDNVKAYLKKVIVEADERVKLYAEDNPETKGMGSTIVMAWLIGSSAYIAWLGDSRAYSYVPGKGIARLSKDHSFVQELVDARRLTEEEAMNHDMSNVITRNLGDISQKAAPDVIVHKVCEGEMIVLCSDGLCGYCTDGDISNIIERTQHDLVKCQVALTKAALDAGGSDNITVALLQVVKSDIKNEGKNNRWFSRITWKELTSLLVLLLLCLALFFPFTVKKSGEEKLFIDSISVKLDGKELCYGDNLHYNVIVSPEKAEQTYIVRHNNNNLKIDKENNILSMKDNVSGEDTLTFISKVDALKRTTVFIKLIKKDDKHPQPPGDKKKDDGTQIGIRLIIDGVGKKDTLFSDKEYRYRVKINDVETDNYEIERKSSNVVIDRYKQIISVLSFKGSEKCIFVISSKSNPSSSKEFPYILKGELNESSVGPDGSPTEIPLRE